ncbi:hypothetical protein Hypma_001515 [Hypsizygus marmoreus]|uniref:Uncharacterized protein n=1 Tax=Hypsizygus marmoreus TaxID=39966 RepID=A0A369KB90_HYPMA|nr:hypothetical protein Hypma_001515 [Hypsizygus marmoreus]
MAVRSFRARVYAPSSQCCVSDVGVRGRPLQHKVASGIGVPATCHSQVRGVGIGIMMIRHLQDLTSRDCTVAGRSPS